MATPRAVVRGSARQAIASSAMIGMPDPGAPITVTVVLRRKAELPKDLPQPVSREEFAQKYGASEEDVRAVEQFAAEHDLTVLEVNPARRSILLSGTVANMNEAFGTQLRLFQSPNGVFRGRLGVLTVPVSVADRIVSVLGLDDRPQARTRCRRHQPVAGVRAAGDTSYTPGAIAALYNYPTANKGTGQSIAIIELGGGFKLADLKTYFTGIGMAQPPSVVAIAVDGAQNQPTGDPNGPDGEVLLDIEVAGAIAPGASLAVYFGPNTDQGFLDAITTAIHDTVHKPSVVSISWGGPESTWSDQALTAYDEAFQDAGALGVTVCCASGDDGSADGVNDGTAHVDFPASSPNVLACGGTRLESQGGKISGEVVWNHGPGNGASGGGVSGKFALPGYQANAKVPAGAANYKGRGVPDVAGDADPSTGYQVYVDGHSAIYGGTSAVAPLWASLVALMNEQAGKPLGFLNPALYRIAPQAFRDITSGNNGAYHAATGWDACTGLGSPDGTALLSALKSTLKKEAGTT